VSWWQFKEYVSVAERHAKAKREVAKLAKKGRVITPVEIAGRTIASTFWGKAWCEQLESHSDFETRLPRGRSYVRNGSVVDLQISTGKIAAMVSGSELYEVAITIKPLSAGLWKSIQARCAGQIGSLLELLQGRLSSEVMQVVTHREEGLFPKPEEIEMRCSCPDWATMCKHVAATLYGVGARLDQQPELLFQLRKVDQGKLIVGVGAAAELAKPAADRKRKTIAADQLGNVFGIELDHAASVDNSDSVIAPPPRPRRRSTKRVMKSQAKPRRSQATVQIARVDRGTTGPRPTPKVAKSAKIASVPPETNARSVKRVKPQAAAATSPMRPGRRKAK
jgi:uncharacterized Zn finger protein